MLKRQLIKRNTHSCVLKNLNKIRLETIRCETCSCRLWKISFTNIGQDLVSRRFWLSYAAITNRSYMSVTYSTKGLFLAQRWCLFGWVLALLQGPQADGTAISWSCDRGRRHTGFLKLLLSGAGAISTLISLTSQPCYLAHGFRGRRRYCQAFVSEKACALFPQSLQQTEKWTRVSVSIDHGGKGPWKVETCSGC